MNKIMIIAAIMPMFFISRTGMARTEALISQARVQQNHLVPGERLFPLSCYGQAVELCMRVLSDHRHHYDAETAADLCVGRLCRLAQAVGQMERKHLSQQKYCSEDITYILGLMGIVCKERAESLALSTMASSLFSSIESRLALLLRCP